MTLDDNDIRDGELLLLTTSPSAALEATAHDTCYTVASTAVDDREPASRTIAVAAWLCAGVIGAAALLWSGLVTDAAGNVLSATVVAAAAAVGAVMTRRAATDTLPAMAMGTVAIVFAAVVGFLVVPSGPSMTNVLLAAAAALSTSIVLLRLLRCGTAYLTGASTFTALVSVVAVGGVVWTLPTEALGAGLAVLSLGTLGSAARLSIAMASLSPAMPITADRVDDDIDIRAENGHQVLTGLLVGSSCAAALGCAMVAVGHLQERGSWPGTAAFTAAVGLTLLMRTRTHILPSRRLALAGNGISSVAVSFALTVIAAPAQAYWLTVLIVAAGAVAVGWLLGMPFGPVAQRAAELSEYVALAAVVPLGCWVIDLYAVVREMSLT